MAFDYFLLLSLIGVILLCNAAEAWVIQLLLLFLTLILCINMLRKRIKYSENKFFSKFDILKMNWRKLEKKLKIIGKKINMVKKNVELTDEHKDGGIRNGQNILFEYLNDYFNEYLKLLFIMVINENMELEKLVKENKIEEIDIKRFIEQVRKNVIMENDKINSYRDGYKNNLSDEVLNKIEEIKLELIVLQSNALLKNISPINNHYEIEKIKNIIGYESNKKNIIILDKKYDDFLIELKSIGLV